MSKHQDTSTQEPSSEQTSKERSDRKEKDDPTIDVVAVPFGYIELTDEQHGQLREVGYDVRRLQIVSCVPLSRDDRFMPLANVPGLAGIVLQFGKPVSKPVEFVGSKIVMALVREVEAGLTGHLQLHSKLMAPAPTVRQATKVEHSDS